MIGGKVDVEPRNGRTLLAALPPFIHVSASTSQSTSSVLISTFLVRWSRGGSKR
jgi:hypothetical protein